MTPCSHLAERNVVKDVSKTTSQTAYCVYNSSRQHGFSRQAKKVFSYSFSVNSISHNNYIAACTFVSFNIPLLPFVESCHLATNENKAVSLSVGASSRGVVTPAPIAYIEVVAVKSS